MRDMIFMGLVGAVCIVVVTAAAVHDMKDISKCKDAGGVPVRNLCINPSAIIEVN